MHLTFFIDRLLIFLEFVSRMVWHGNDIRKIIGPQFEIKIYYEKKIMNRRTVGHDIKLSTKIISDKNTFKKVYPIASYPQKYK